MFAKFDCLASNEFDSWIVVGMKVEKTLNEVRRVRSPTKDSSKDFL